jgi:hypothetical protein
VEIVSVQSKEQIALTLQWGHDMHIVETGSASNPLMKLNPLYVSRVQLAGIRRPAVAIRGLNRD